MKTVACEIFRTEVEHLLGDGANRIEWLPAGLHTDLAEMGERLESAVHGEDCVVLLYGEACHPDMGRLGAGAPTRCLAGKDCVAAFLGEEERRELEGRRAFVMSPGWLRNWREIFREGCGWDDVGARQNFGFYDVVILLDFGLEPIDDLEVLEFFEYTQTPVEIRPASLDRFARTLGTVCGERLPLLQS